MKTSALILAAGRGYRMRKIGVKPLLKIKEKTFLEIAIEKIYKANFHPIIIVINPGLIDKIKLSPGIKIVVNYHPENGMLSSIQCGLAAIGDLTTGFLLNPVDFPLVNQETYLKLWDYHQKNIDSIIRPVFNGRAGHPVIFPAVLYEELKKCPLKEGARFVIKNNPKYILDIEVDDFGILTNINTPELYLKYYK